MALYLDVEAGDAVRVGSYLIEIEAKSGKRTRLRISGGADVRYTKSGTQPKAPERQIPVLTRPSRR